MFIFPVFVIWDSPKSKPIANQRGGPSNLFLSVFISFYQFLLIILKIDKTPLGASWH